MVKLRGPGGPTVAMARTAVRRMAPIRCCLPARHEDCFPATVHKHVDDLFQRRHCAYTVEMLGIPLPDRNQDRAFTWESTSHTLCIQKKLELSTCRTAINNELTERLSQVYTVVICRRDCKNTNPRDGEPGRFERGAQAQRR